MISRPFDAPRRLVWDAWTSPEHLPNWMLGPEGWTMPVCEIDLRPGEAWHCLWRHSDGSEMETILYPSKEARDAALQTGMREGMSLSFERLAAYLRGEGLA